MHLKRHSPRRVSALVTLAVLLPTSSAFAQTTTATVRGTVFDDTGALPGAAIVAKETGSGFTHEATSGADGGFTLPGLRPGTYEISVSMQQYKPAARRLTVLVGQDVDLDFRLTADLVYAENITVVGDTAVETRTSEIATYVTARQLRDLVRKSSPSCGSSPTPFSFLNVPQPESLAPLQPRLLQKQW